MSNLTMNSNSDSTTLSVPKLHDDGSNWADYQPRIERALGGLYSAPRCPARLQPDTTGQQCHQNPIFSGEFLHHLLESNYLYS